MTGVLKSSTGVSLTARTEHVPSDTAIPPGRKFFLLIALNDTIKLNHAAFDCRLQGFLTVPRFAISRSDVVCLFTRINSRFGPPKSQHCLISTGYALWERMSGNVCLKKSQGSYMELMLKIKSYCIVSITIPILVTIKTLILPIQVDQMYQPCHKRHCLPPYRPDLATSNVSPNNKGNTNYNGQCSEKDLFTTSSWQVRQIDEPILTTMSPSE